MNLPMLIKLSSVRKGDNMGAALAEAQAAGRKYINVASQLSERQMNALPGSVGPDQIVSAISDRQPARAACARLGQVRPAGRAASTPQVRVEKDGVTVGGTSIMGLMMLAASPGCSIRVYRQRARRPAQVMDAAGALIASRFGEEGVGPATPCIAATCTNKDFFISHCRRGRRSASQAAEFALDAPCARRRHSQDNSHRSNCHDGRSQGLCRRRHLRLPTGAARKSRSPKPRCRA